MKKVMMLHSVNHNMYGKRDPEQYGTITLDEINDLIEKTAKDEGILEIHMSNIFNREDFRSHSVIAPVAHGMIAGMGASAYSLAVKAMGEIFRGEDK